MAAVAWAESFCRAQVVVSTPSLSEPAFRAAIAGALTGLDPESSLSPAPSDVHILSLTRQAPAPPPSAAAAMPGP